MIDRITIYIDDVKFEDVEKRLGLTPSKVAEDESLIYSSLISNLRFTYKGNRLTITGSLHKYAKGNNYSLFTYEEAKAVLLKLSDNEHTFEILYRYQYRIRCQFSDE